MHQFIFFLIFKQKHLGGIHTHHVERRHLIVFHLEKVYVVKF